LKIVNMSKKSLHHIVAKSTWWTNHTNNLKAWTEVPHRAFTTLYNNLPFRCQVAELMNLQGRTIDKRVKSDVIWYLESYKNKDLYNPQTVDLHKLHEWEQRNKNLIKQIIGNN